MDSFWRKDLSTMLLLVKYFNALHITHCFYIKFIWFKTFIYLSLSIDFCTSTFWLTLDNKHFLFLLIDAHLSDWIYVLNFLKRQMTIKIYGWNVRHLASIGFYGSLIMVKTFLRLYLTTLIQFHRNRSSRFLVKIDRIQCDRRTVFGISVDNA